MERSLSARINGVGHHAAAREQCRDYLQIAGVRRLHQQIEAVLADSGQGRTMSEQGFDHGRRVPLDGDLQQVFAIDIAKVEMHTRGLRIIEVYLEVRFISIVRGMD